MLLTYSNPAVIVLPLVILFNGCLMAVDFSCSLDKMAIVWTAVLVQVLRLHCLYLHQIAQEILFVFLC